MGFLILLFSCDHFPPKELAANNKLANYLEKEAQDDLPPNALSKSRLKNYIDSAIRIKPDRRSESAFKNLDYDKIIAYNFEGSEELYPSVIDKRGEFVPVITAQHFLNQKQADTLLYSLSQNTSYGGSTAACFMPHLGLVFYKDKKKVAVINICLDCNYLISDVNIPAMNSHKKNKGTKDEHSLFGFSTSGKQQIVNLCKELNFYYSRLKREDSKDKKVE